MRRLEDEETQGMKTKKSFPSFIGVLKSRGLGVLNLRETERGHKHACLGTGDSVTFRLSFNKY
jgi:hypothetical protein